ncbi:MAG TPA: glycosyltransferase [Chloroflexaceae bacterium]|nr:glycosyltransferase [Chloroflexaceae bacterium]
MQPTLFLDDGPRPAPAAAAVELSVIIPALNVAPVIGDQLAALAAQDWDGAWEVIVADNGSRDGTVEVARRYQARLPDLRILDASGRQGAAFARNVGAQAAQGEALVFIDADDIVAPGFLRAMAAALREHPFSAPRIDATSLNSAWAARLGEHPQYHGLMRYYNEPFLHHASGCGLGMRRSLFLRLGGFDESLLRLQDTELCFRAQLAGVPMHFVPEARVAMRNRQSFRGMLRQARDWGKAEVSLVSRYRRMGGPWRLLYLWLRYTARWLKLLARLLGARSRQAVALVAKEAARQVGIFEAALRTGKPPV